MFYGQGPSPFMSNSFGFGGMGGAMGAPQQAPQAPQGPRPMAQGAQPGGNSGQLWNKVLNDPGPRVGDPYQQPTSRPTMGPGQSWQPMGVLGSQEPPPAWSLSKNCCNPDRYCGACPPGGWGMGDCCGP
jgi:hypothetical protein